MKISLNPRTIFFLANLIVLPLVALSLFNSPQNWGLPATLIFFFLVGWYDVIQKEEAILRAYPVVGHLRFILLGISPEIHQYFTENSTDGQPFSKNLINLIKSRAEGKEEYHPFGTEHDLYNEGVEWVSHTMFPVEKLDEPPRVAIGGKECKAPYSAALLNISAMSFGSLSENAIKALSWGAKLGGFYHNTGEGGVSPYHLKSKADIVLQIGTANFGFRNTDGTLNDEKFQEKAGLEQIKMIEIKLSQGAKPGHGGVLPAIKNTEEIAAIRDVKPYTAVVSPPHNKSFSTKKELVSFIARIRKLAGYKPVGIKLCIGRKDEFETLIDECINMQVLPDFISVDAAEGGTGAAPIELSNHVGMRGEDALKFVHSCLLEKGVRDQIKIIYSGKINSAFSLFKALCMGADLCNSARGFMFSLGCIQALRCHTDTCPTGVATQDKQLQVALVPTDKSQRVHMYQKNTVDAFLELMATTGARSTAELNENYIHKLPSYLLKSKEPF